MALAALVLTVLAVGPGLDRLICRDEAGMSAAAAEWIVTDEVEANDTKHVSNEGGACLHGHCHHSAPFAVAIPVAADAPMVQASSVHRLARDRVGTSDPKFGVERPPRA